MNFNKLRLITWGILFLVYTSSFAQSNNTVSKPNIIVIMADDMGYADAGFTGSKDILTPNIDNLAKSGVVFENGYTNHPFCSPSRAALLSGRYPYRFGFETNPAYDPSNPYMGISTGEKLFPKRLQEVGYTTGIIGKWHLGAAEQFHPINRGFDYFYGFLGGGHDYFKIDLTQKVEEAYLHGLIRNDQPTGFEGYLTTALSNDAVNFINENKGNQFFLFVSYNAPHAPLQAPKEDIERYAHIKNKKRRVYAAMVDVMDRGIGKIMESLKKNGIYGNTLVFFLSDNGGPIPTEQYPYAGNGSSNAPFRDGKGSFYQGGIRVPFVASWPDKIKAGLRVDYPVNSLDIARTAVELAGADAMATPKMEGVNLIPYVNGENKGVPHEYLCWRGLNGKVWTIVNSEGMKYIQSWDNDSPQLFNLNKDISETSDLSNQNPEEAKKLSSAWNDWNKKNVPWRMFGYMGYHKARDKFYRDAIPDEAKATGYPETK